MYYEAASIRTLILSIFLKAADAGKNEFLYAASSHVSKNRGALYVEIWRTNPLIKGTSDFRKLLVKTIVTF